MNSLIIKKCIVGTLSLGLDMLTPGLYILHTRVFLFTLKTLYMGLANANLHRF